MLRKTEDRLWEYHTNLSILKRIDRMPGQRSFVVDNEKVNLKILVDKTIKQYDALIKDMIPVIEPNVYKRMVRLL